jgi:hypothetical protein
MNKHVKAAYERAYPGYLVSLQREVRKTRVAAKAKRRLGQMQFRADKRLHDEGACQTIEGRFCYFCRVPSLDA